MKELFIIYCIYLLLLSFITFCAYGIDKRKARKGKRRISEKALLSMSFFGGALGGILGMTTFRHKTTLEHWYFTFVNILGLLVHGALAVYLFTLI